MAGASWRLTRPIPREILRRVRTGKKLQGNLDQIVVSWNNDRPLRLMFQDEARFGRIPDTRYCWCRRPVRPLVNAMVTQQYTDAASLEGKAIGTERGSEFDRQMRELSGVKVEEVTSMRQNILKLLAHRVDLVYYHQLGLEWEIKEGGFANQIALTKNSFGDVKMHYVMFSKSVPQNVIDEIERALISMKADGTIDTILAAYK